MSEAENRLFGLMAVVEDQQAMLQAALEGLRAERGLLQDEREIRTREMEAMAKRQQAAVLKVLEDFAKERMLLQDERGVLARKVSAVETSAAAAVGVAVNTSLAGAATIAAAAVERGARPLLEKLDGVVEGAEQAQAALRRVVLWASWRLLGWIAAVALVMVLTGWAINAAVLWRDRRDIHLVEANRAVLEAQITVLQGQIVDLQTNRDDLIGTVGISVCGLA